MKKKKFRNLCLAAVLGIAAFAGVCSYDAGAGTNIHIINVRMIRQENCMNPIIKSLKNTGKKKQDRMSMSSSHTEVPANRLWK